jgi:hypothetical protein
MRLRTSNLGWKVCSKFPECRTAKKKQPRKPATLRNPKKSGKNKILRKVLFCPAPAVELARLSGPIV